MTRLKVFTGKGGVGKTTIACAFALKMADMGYRTLLLSSDPQPSIHDSFKMDKISSIKPQKHEETDNLWMMEIDGKMEYKKFMYHVETARKEIKKYFPEVGIPGMDELATLLKVFNYMFDLRYDIIVLDTAPIGHTRRLYELPDYIQGMLKGLKRYVIDPPGIMKKVMDMVLPERIKRLQKDIAVIKSGVLRVKDVLSDPDVTTFSIVSVPEFMIMKETLKAMEYFREYGTETDNIIFNKVIADNHNCECMICQNIKKLHHRYMEKIEARANDKYDGTNFITTPIHRNAEIMGLNSLREMGGHLFGDDSPGFANFKPSNSYRIKRVNGEVHIETNMPQIDLDKFKFKWVNQDDRRGIEFMIDYGLHEKVPNFIRSPKHRYRYVKLKSKGKNLTIVLVGPIKWSIGNE